MRYGRVQLEQTMIRVEVGPGAHAGDKVAELVVKAGLDPSADVKNRITLVPVPSREAGSFLATLLVMTAEIEGVSAEDLLKTARKSFG